MNAPPDDRRLTGRWFDAKPAKHRAEAAALRAARKDGRRQGAQEMREIIRDHMTKVIRATEGLAVVTEIPAIVKDGFLQGLCELARSIASLPLPGDVSTAAAAPSTPRGPAPTGTAAAAPSRNREDER